MLLVKIVAEITDGSQRPDGRGLIASSKIDPSAGQSRKAEQQRIIELPGDALGNRQVCAGL